MKFGDYFDTKLGCRFAISSFTTCRKRPQLFEWFELLSYYCFWDSSCVPSQESWSSNCGFVLGRRSLRGVRTP